MKKWLYSSLIILLTLTGCAQKNGNEIEMSSEINTQADFINELALHDAVRAKDLAIVNELIEKGTNVNTKDKYGYTALHLAARLNQYEIAKTLIKNGASVNTIDIYKDTPLLDSTRNSTNAMSKLLICNGAKRNVVDRHKMSPLHNASKNNDIYIVKLIKADDISLMCGILDISLDYYNEPEDLICGRILEGVATNVNLTIVEESNEEDKPFGTYKADINENKYCAKLDKKLVTNAAYVITAVGTNSIEKDIEVSNLNDLLKKKEQSEYITGLYEDLMQEFGPDFEPWNAELDKNGLVFRFKKPDVLFTVGSSDLRVAFKDILDDFFPRYLKVLNKYTNEIEKVRVEGHTSSEFRRAKNDEQRYVMNKELSEKRANKVLVYTLENLSEIVGQTKPWLDTVYEAEGMSYDHLIYNADGSENKVLSRRVEFRINKIMQ